MSASLLSVQLSWYYSRADFPQKIISFYPLFLWNPLETLHGTKFANLLCHQLWQTQRNVEDAIADLPNMLAVWLYRQNFLGHWAGSIQIGEINVRAADLQMFLCKYWSHWMRTVRISTVPLNRFPLTISRWRLRTDRTTDLFLKCMIQICHLYPSFTTEWLT